MSVAEPETQPFQRVDAPTAVALVDAALPPAEMLSRFPPSALLKDLLAKRATDVGLARKYGKTAEEISQARAAVGEVVARNKRLGYGRKVKAKARYEKQLKRAKAIAKAKGVKLKLGAKPR